MLHRTAVGVILPLIVALLLNSADTASASEAPVSGANETALPVESRISEITAAAEQITISTDRPTASISLRAVPILVNVGLQRAGEPVPDGTAVDFTITSGSGILSEATTTVNGIATVRLSSTTVGMVIVNAGAGTVSAGISASFLAQPEQAIVKVATVGAPASTSPIGGLLASVIFPASGYEIPPGGVTPSGAASGPATILSANIETAGQVILALLDVNGIQAGEFATLTFLVTDGFLPSIGDFAVSSAPSVFDAVNNAAIQGISVVVQSLTLK